MVARLGRNPPGACLLLLAVVACGSETASPGGKAGAGSGNVAGAGASSFTGGSGGSGGSGMAGASGAMSSGGGVGGNAGAGASGIAGAGAGANAGGGAGVGAGGFTIHVELASDIKATSPTTVGIVTWALERPGITEAHIDFGLDTAYGMTAPVDLGRADYRTVLVGMKPAKTYHFRIVATDGSATTTSDDQTLTTGAPLTGLPLTSFSVPFPERVDEGFFIGSFWAITTDEPWTVFILDTDGDVVWWYTSVPETSGGERGYGRARLSANSEDVWLVQVSNGGGLVRRVSIDTLDEQVYPDTIVGSHDICAVEGDTMAYIDYGEAGCESIFEIDKTGATKEVFEGEDVRPPEANGCHGNAVRYSKKEDVYVYSDHRNDVVVVGRDGTVQWKLSERVSGGNAAWGGFQHGIQLLDESMLIFANGGSADMDSEALEFGLDGRLIKRFASHSQSNFYGDVQRMPNGNTLINYANGLVHVVDSSDTVVLEMRALTFFGYMEFRQSLYGLPLDIQQ